MFTLKIIVGLSAIVLGLETLEAAYFPSYIVPCSKSDPNLNECALEHGRNAIPKIVKGDKKLKLRSLDPLRIPEINIDTNQMKITLFKSKLRGLSQLELKDMNINVKEHKMDLFFTSKKLDVEGTYNISGQILILPISGSGKLEASIFDAKIGYTFNYDFVERDGITYIDPKPPVVTLEAPKSTYRLENLFNGDKRLGDEMNRFLNENHDVMLNEVGPSIRETIAAIAQDIVRKIIGTLPYDDLLAP